MEIYKCTACGITFNIIRHTETASKLLYYRAASLDRLTRGAHFVIERVGHSSPPKLEQAITAVELVGFVVLGHIMPLLVALQQPIVKRPRKYFFCFPKAPAR